MQTSERPEELWPFPGPPRGQIGATRASTDALRSCSERVKVLQETAGLARSKFSDERLRTYSLGSTGSLSSANTPNTHSWTLILFEPVTSATVMCARAAASRST